MRSQMFDRTAIPGSHPGRACKSRRNIGTDASVEHFKPIHSQNGCTPVRAKLFPRPAARRLWAELRLLESSLLDLLSEHMTVLRHVCCSPDPGPALGRSRPPRRRLTRSSAGGPVPGRCHRQNERRLPGCPRAYDCMSMHDPPGRKAGCTDVTAVMRASFRQRDSRAWSWNSQLQRTAHGRLATRTNGVTRRSAKPQRSYTCSIANRDFIDSESRRLPRAKQAARMSPANHRCAQQLMSPGAMFWGGASYKRGLPFKPYIWAEAYPIRGQAAGREGRCCPTNGANSLPWRASTGYRAAQWETAQPGRQTSVVFEPGGRGPATPFPRRSLFFFFFSPQKHPVFYGGLQNLNEPGRPDRKCPPGDGDRRPCGIPDAAVAKEQDQRTHTTKWSWSFVCLGLDVLICRR